MCIIAVCNDRKLNNDELYACWENNKDGAGMAWFEGHNHVIRKGFMNYEVFKNEYSRIDVLPHVVHFRIATAGGIIPELTHPFICTRKSPPLIEWVGEEPVLFHNGIVTNWHAIAEMMGIQIPNTFWSDTRVIASILSQWDLDFLEEEGGKYAVLVGDEIKIYGNFVEEKGILFSNRDYEEVWFAGGWWYNQYGTPYGNQWGGKYAKPKSYTHSCSYSHGKPINICNSCKDGNSTICNHCSEKDNSPWLKAQPYNHCDYCAYYPGSRYCDYCPHAPATELASDDGHVAFSECDGKCSACGQYDSANNTCMEVELAMEERRTALLLLEHKVEAELARVAQDTDYEDCPERGDGCLTCSSFNPEFLECSVWD